MTRQIISCSDIRGFRYQVRRPTPSFFSPLKGVPVGTVVALTGEILVESSMKFGPGQDAYPKTVIKIGITWGKNMKGTDWVTSARLKRNMNIVWQDQPASRSARPAPHS